MSDVSVNSGIRIAVVGGGAAGMMAAATAAGKGASVTVFEQNAKLGRKLSITGKGRCNVTNDCDMDMLMSSIPTNPRFLYSAFSGFGPRDTMDFFESRGVPLKVERGNRVFPCSDKASDIVRALCGSAKYRTVREKVRGIKISDSVASGVVTDAGEYVFDRVIMCTGGRSYPLTGSDGSGYRIAERAGHTIIPPKPSLVPLETKERWCARLQGLSLKNTAMRVIDSDSGKCVYDDFGEMLFTHFGVSGPMILSASAHISNMRDGRYKIIFDLKPALDEKAIDRRILSDFNKYSNRDFSNSLSDLLPQKLIPVTVELSGIPASKKVHDITREERMRLIRCLKELTVTVSGFRPIDEAIITKGGVSTKEINPKTMESKIVKNLYFAGEMIDVDAYTGGFNLQIAFSTAVLAAESACGY